MRERPWVWTLALSHMLCPKCHCACWREHLLPWDCAELHLWRVRATGQLACWALPQSQVLCLCGRCCDSVSGHHAAGSAEAGPLRKDTQAGCSPSCSCSLVIWPQWVRLSFPLKWSGLLSTSWTGCHRTAIASIFSFVLFWGRIWLFSSGPQTWGPAPRAGIVSLNCHALFLYYLLKTKFLCWNWSWFCLSYILNYCFNFGAVS